MKKTMFLLATLIALPLMNQTAAVNAAAQTPFSTKLDALSAKMQSIDDVIEFHDWQYVEKKDERTHLSEYGLRPALVICLRGYRYHLERKAEHADKMLKLLKEADLLAKAAREKGCDAVLLHYGNRADLGSLPEVVEDAKIKSLDLALVRLFADGAGSGKSAFYESNFKLMYNDEPSLRYSWMNAPGRLEMGNAFNSIEIKKTIDALPMVPEELAEIQSSLATWQFEKVYKSLEAEELAEQRKVYDAAIAGAANHYRAAFVKPLLDKGYAVLAHQALEKLADSYGRSDAGEKLKAELKELKSSDAYKKAKKSNKGYLKCREAFDTADSKMKVTTSASVYVSEQIRVWGDALKVMEPFVKKFGDSPHGPEVKGWVEIARDRVAKAEASANKQR